MISMFKTLAVLGVVAGSALVAQPAKADHVSFGLGISVPAVRTYVAPPQVCYQPAYVPPVVTYVTPTYTTYTTDSSTPANCITTVVSPAPVVYAPPPVVYYSAPVYAAPVYYSSPGLGMGFFGGHGRR